MMRPWLSPAGSKSNPPLPTKPSSKPKDTPRTGIRVRPRVLIVDDHDDTREMYTWCLRAAGWFVESVSNGAQALQLVLTFEPHVVVMDLGMPVLDGLETTRWLKQNEDTKGVPVVAVTGSGMTPTEAREAGCDAFVAKPCEPEKLRQLLEELVAGHGVTK